MEFLHAQNNLAKIRDNKVIIQRDWPNDKDKLRGAFAIARDLAAKAKG